MLIKPNQEVRHGYLVYEADKVYDVEDTKGAYFLANNWAAEVDEDDHDGQVAASLDTREMDDDELLALKDRAKERAAERASGETEAVSLDVHDAIANHRADFERS